MTTPTGQPRRARRTKVEMLKAKQMEIEKVKKIDEIRNATDPTKVLPIASPVEGEFQPLPLLGAGDPPPVSPTNPTQNVSSDTATVSDPERDKLLKEGMAGIVSEDLPRLLKNFIVLMGWEKVAGVNPPSPARAALWAEFALPMLRKYFPNFDSEIMFWVLTASLVGSMVEIKKEKVETNATKAITG